MVVPTKLKLLRGRPGHHPIRPEPEPLIPAEVPDPPDHLSEPARVEWRRIAPELLRLGLLTIADLGPLAAYCQAYGRWTTAEKAVAAIASDDERFAGLAARNDNGRLVQSPLVRTANEAARDMVQFAVQFGLTPVARMKLGAGSPNKPKKFDGLVSS